MDVFYLNNPAYVEDVTLKVWATKTQTITFQDAPPRDFLLETGGGLLLENGANLLLE
jgi:hypothetical protein